MTSPMPRWRHRSWRHALALAGLASAAGALVCAAHAADAPPDRGMAVSVTTVARHCFKNRIAVSGVLVPTAEFQVRPEREGMVIADVLVEPGDAVVRGQNLVRLVQPPGAPAGNAAVKAPAKGTVVQVAAVVGAYTTATGDPMVRIVANGELELRADVLNDDLTRIKPGQRVDIRVRSNETLPGRVRTKEPLIDPLTQLGAVRISFDGDPRLISGAFIRAEIDGGAACGRAVPLSAVLYGAEGIIVQVVEDGRIVTRRVTLGLLDKELAEIRDGIADGSVVVTRAGSFLREGDRIRAVQEDLGAPK